MRTRAAALVIGVSVASHAPGSAGRPSFLLISANVGNLDALTGGPCREWPARGALCVPEDEAAASAALAAHGADLIALYEVLPGDRDASARRIVGPEYTVICDEIGGYDCLALRSSRFTVTSDVTPPQPAACLGQGDFSAVFAVDATWDGAPMRIVVAHPYQAFDDEEDRCREAQLRQAFDDLPAGDTLIVGDFNMDPDRMWWFYESPQVWHEHVGRGRPFHALDAAWVLPEPTWLGVFTLDRVAARGFEGGCTTEPALADRMDHRVRRCSVSRSP